MVWTMPAKEPLIKAAVNYFEAEKFSYSRSIIEALIN